MKAIREHSSGVPAERDELMRDLSEGPGRARRGASASTSTRIVNPKQRPFRPARVGPELWAMTDMLDRKGRR